MQKTIKNNLFLIAIVAAFCFFVFLFSRIIPGFEIGEMMLFLILIMIVCSLPAFLGYITSKPKNRFNSEDSSVIESDSVNILNSDFVREDIRVYNESLATSNQDENDFNIEEKYTNQDKFKNEVVVGPPSVKDLSDNLGKDMADLMVGIKNKVKSIENEGNISEPKKKAGSVVKGLVKLPESSILSPREPNKKR